MITLLTGANSFETERALAQIVAGFEGTPEKFDGTELELKQLPDLLMGMSLFAEKRLVIVRDLSANKEIWEVLPELLERMSDDVHLVLVEPSVDKRLKTYKTIQKIASVKNFPLLTERDSAKAERWIKEEAQRVGARLEPAAVKVLLQRCLVVPEKGPLVIDQWQAYRALEKLSVFDVVTVATVEQYIDTQPTDSVFSIFEAALRSDVNELHRLLAEVEAREDPFRLFGLLSGQVFHLAALAVSDLPTVETAKEIGTHSYGASRLQPIAKRLSSAQIKKIVLAFADTDEAIKLSKAAPWILVEQALMKTAVVTKKK